MVAIADNPLFGASVPNKIANGIAPTINGRDAFAPSKNSDFLSDLLIDSILEYVIKFMYCTKLMVKHKRVSLLENNN